ncbi:MAG TPA: MMPL family transporter [Candidatus Nanopelagicaceae bacterium]|nr:MMPL family transporter [Candidatus Nanopelagicaceae bacterium]
MSGEKTDVVDRRRRWALPALLLIAWLVIGGVVGPYAGKLNEVIKNDNAAFLPKNSEATLALKAQQALAGAPQPVFGTLVFEKQSGLSASDISAIDAFVARVPSIKVPEGFAIGSFLVPAPITPITSADGKAVSAVILFDDLKSAKPFDNGKNAIAESVVTIREEMAKAKLDGHVGGIAGILGDLIGVFQGINGTLLYTTIIVVSLILILVYRSPFLWAIPLLVVGMGDALAQAVVYFLAKNNIVDLNGQAQGILLILVFGVGTDYSLLLVARYREELRNFTSKYDAMRHTIRSVIEPIGASAATVAVGLLCLSFSVLSSNKSTGPVCAVGVVCAFIAVMTLLPALLLLFGRRLFWPKRPNFGSDHPEEKGIWGDVARSVGAHSRRAWVAGTILLLVLCSFVFTLQAHGLSNSFTKRTDAVVANEVLARHFPAGEGSPVNIISPADKIEQVVRVSKTVPGIAQVSVYTGIPTGAPTLDATRAKIVNGIGEVDAVLSTDPFGSQSQLTIIQLRNALHAQVGTDVLVGGMTAIDVDTQSASHRDRNVIIPIVLIVILLILMLLLRSVIAPVLLIASVVASFIATLGVCALVFNHIFHFSGADTSFPLFSFTFLVALGVDYNIFLMTRVREETKLIGTRAGTLKALTVTGGVITSAGVVLAATFAVLGVLPLVFLAEIGFAVGFGVLLDTILVRSIIVPALVHDIGPKVWWPSALQNDSAIETQPRAGGD